MHNRFDGIDVFVLVVESGSFAKAAERLHLSRSAVGKSIARLETRLGVKLFHRTTRSQTLTEDGALLLEHSLRAYQEMDAAQNLLENGKRELRGTLRVSLPVLFGRRCVAPLFTALARQHPALTLELSFSDRVVNMVDEGFDLAIRNGALQDSADKVARHLAWHDMQLCASPEYLLRHGTPVTIEQLTAHQGIMYMNSSYTLPWQFIHNGNVTPLLPPSRLFMDDLEAIADAVESGDGIGWLPHWLIRERIGSGCLTPLLPETESQRFPVHAVWPKTRWLPLKVRIAVDMLLAELPKVMAPYKAPRERH